MAYKITKQENTFKTFICVDPSKGFPRPIMDSEFDETKHVKEWVEWKRLSWKQSNEIRREAVIRDPIAGTSYVDLLKHRELKFKKLFSGWSLALEDENEKVISPSFRNEELDDKYYQLIINSSSLRDFIEEAIARADKVWELGFEEESEDPLAEEKEVSPLSEGGQA